MKNTSNNTDDNRTRFVPMLFSTPMVQALLKGTKTETRRLINPQPENYNSESIISNCNFKNGNFCFKHKISDNPERFEITDLMKSKVNVGDVIWVRETFRPIVQEIGKPRYEYKATETTNLFDKWKPSIFMPKDACRIFLKVVSVEVERLQDIDEQSAINEGIFEKPCENGTIWYRKFVNEKEARSNGLFTNSAKECYMTLWQKINGLESWENNPFVWVYKFVRVDAPEDFR